MNFFLPFGSVAPFTWQVTASKTTQNAVSPRRAATFLASVFKMMIVDEDVAKSSVSLRDEPTLVAGPRALR
jgi:hypothetical protein